MWVLNLNKSHRKFSLSSSLSYFLFYFFLSFLIYFLFFIFLLFYKYFLKTKINYQNFLNLLLPVTSITSMPRESLILQTLPQMINFKQKIQGKSRVYIRVGRFLSEWTNVSFHSFKESYLVILNIFNPFVFRLFLSW